MSQYKPYEPNHLAVVKWSRIIGGPEFTEVVRGYSEADATRAGYMWGSERNLNFGVVYLGERGDTR